MMTDERIDKRDLLDTLEITKVTRRVPTSTGRWVKGEIGGHRFGAMVFAQHAANPNTEIGESRIWKLWLVRIDDGSIVANFDRGWDIRPTTPVATRIVELLAAGIADFVYED